MISEHDEQSMLIQWARLHEHELPELKLLHAIPNGGWRHKVTAMRLKREGLKAGIPDLCLPVARGDFHGAYIEMKSMKGRVTECQRWWLNHLAEQGYYTIVCKGFPAARDAILAYLDIDEVAETST